MNFDHSHKRVHDAGEQAASLPGWDQRYEQLSAGRFEGEVDELRIGPVQVFAERANQQVMQAGQLSQQRLSIALVRSSGAPGWYCGHRLTGEHLIGIASHGDFDLVASAGMVITALSVDADALRQLATQLEGPAVQLPTLPTLLDATPEAMEKIRTLMHAALALAQAGASACAHAAARRMLVLSLTDAMLACIGTRAVAPLPASAASRRRIVTRARHYMQAHAHEVIAVPDLCQAIGTSRRALQYAFEDVMQISPVTYLRALRLNQVRLELRRPDAAPVGDVAARWGFWHPSRFAADYRAMFGELPSATRGAAAG